MCPLEPFDDARVLHLARNAVELIARERHQSRRFKSLGGFAGGFDLGEKGLAVGGINQRHSLWVDRAITHQARTLEPQLVLEPGDRHGILRAPVAEFESLIPRLGGLLHHLRELHVAKERLNAHGKFEAGRGSHGLRESGQSGKLQECSTLHGSQNIISE